MFNDLRRRMALAILPEKEKKESVSPIQVISSHPANIPIYSPMTVRKATREGYKTSIYVYRSVRTIIQAASAIPWVVLGKDRKIIEGHPFEAVINNPNPEFSGQDMIEFAIAHLLLVGNALWQPIITNHRVTEIWMVMPDLVHPIPSDEPGEWLKGWKVYDRGGAQRTVPPDQFIHFMQVDPGNPYWGTSPLMAAARTIDTDNEAQDTQKISMQNRATPDGVFTHESILSQEQFEEARRQIRENFLAKSKKHEPWVLGAGAKWNQMSMTPVEMDFIASRLHNKRDIAGAFGISPMFLGDLEQSSYNNMMEARKALYEDVVIPLLDDIKSTLNLKIAPMYENITISYDTSRVVALREDFTKKVEQARTLWNMGMPFNQINERLEMGFEEYTGWDVGYLPMQMLPIGSPPKPEKLYESSETKAFDLSTEEQKVIHWKMVDTRRVAWWGVANKKILPLYEKEADAVEKAIKGKTPPEMMISVSKAIDSIGSEWEKIIVAIHLSVIEDFGNETAEALGAKPKPSKAEPKPDPGWVFDPMTVGTQEWVRKYSTECITSIATTNLKDVRNILIAGIDKNLSSAQIAKSLSQFYVDRSPFKAMRVARTEVCKASTFGSLEAAKQSKIIKSKTWITSRDDRVRDGHEAMDGETVPLKETFSNGSDGPDEPMCRCVLSFSTKEVISQKQFEEDFKNGLSRSESTERCSAILRDGTKFSKTGRGRGINFSPKEDKMLTDAPLFVHNHPGIPLPFSPDDIAFAYSNRIKRMVVFDSDYKYIMTPKGTWSKVNMEIVGKLEKGVIEIDELLYEKFFDISLKETVALRVSKNHKLFKDLAEESNIFYSREKAYA